MAPVNRAQQKQQPVDPITMTLCFRLEKTDICGTVLVKLMPFCIHEKVFVCINSDFEEKKDAVLFMWWLFGLILLPAGPAGVCGRLRRRRLHRLHAGLNGVHNACGEGQTVLRCIPPDPPEGKYEPIHSPHIPQLTFTPTTHDISHVKDHCAIETRHINQRCPPSECMYVKGLIRIVGWTLLLVFL